MKILIPAIGSRGDVQPYIALAIGLRKKGHEVTLATHPCLRTLVESYNVSFAPMGPDIDIGQEAAILRRRSANWIVGFKRVMDFSFSMLEQSHSDALELCRKADLVVVSHSAAGSMEVDELGLPWVSVTLMPQAIPANDPNEGLLQKVFMKIGGAVMGSMMVRPLNKIRKRIGLQSMGPHGITSPVLNLIPMSPQIIPPGPYWDPRHKMTGYWFAPSPITWNPPPDLIAFLESGEPPLVISLGAMATDGKDSIEAAGITMEALKMVKKRAIIQGWQEALSKMDIPETVYTTGSIPHDWLLPRCSGIMHHGGFGTTSAGFQAGIPSIVIPHIIDQYLWGNKVTELGVGPKPIPRAKLTVPALAAAIEAINRSEMKEKAAALGSSIRQEPDGVEVAIKMIENAAG